MNREPRTLNTKIKKEFYLWAEGKHIDFWSVNHTLAGGVIAGSTIFLNFSFWLSVAILLSLTIIWEIYETVKNIHETTKNRVIDVIVAVIGYILMYIVMNAEILNNVILFTVITISFVTLNILGNMAYRKRQKYLK
jgi:hypothetical protein